MTSSDNNLFAWQVLGFGEYIEEVYSAYEQHKIETTVAIHLLVILCYLDLRDYSYYCYGQLTFGMFIYIMTSKIYTL